MASPETTHYLRSIIPSLPAEFATRIRSICATPANETMLENLVRFLVNAEYASDAPEELREQWLAKQIATRAVITSLNSTLTDRKRTREDEGVDSSTNSQHSKRQRVSPVVTANGMPTLGSQDPGRPIFAFHSVSTTSPIRKKVDITIHQHAIVFTNASSKAVEGTVPLSSIKRAFIVPTRGKSKPHWTVILLSGDIPDNPKTKATPGATVSENQQIIFGLDANSATSFSTTSYDANGEPTTTPHPKNTPTLPSIQDFLSKLSIPIVQPSATVFKSACVGVGSSAGTDGIPGVEAYRAAKAGNLWFSKEGILWGESKPCEFWAVGDLIGKSEGVRMVGAGRTFSLILTRRTMGADAQKSKEVGKENDMDVDEEDLGEETEFGMVDGREREGINEWVRAYRNLFGTNGRPVKQPSKEDKGKGKEKATSESSKVKTKPANTGPITIRSLQEDSDSEDEDFSADISDLDGSEVMSGEDSSDSDNDGSDEEGSNDEGEVNSNDDGEHDEDDEVEELDPAHHPLLRPGAMPRMSKAALNMAVGIIEDAFTEGGDKQVDGQHQEDDELEEEDELAD